MAFFIVAGWAVAMSRLGWWGIFAETWPISLTMVFGSFIAGATAEGGGAVAFPVFTKLFGIDARDARIFAFMIQSFGMTMAALVIWLRGIRVLWNVVGVGVAAGVVGLLLGENLLALPDPYPKLVFTVTALVFGGFLVVNRWWIDDTPLRALRLDRPLVVVPILMTGFVGGLISSVVGVGLDMMIFIVLTLLLGIDEKVSTPTTVVMMGLLSLAGFAWHLQLPGSISGEVWGYWMSCIPIVIFGAPLGAWFCQRISRDQLIGLLLVLIAVEFVTTLWVVPIGSLETVVLLGVVGVTTVLFALLIRGRGKLRRLDPNPGDHDGYRPA